MATPHWSLPQGVPWSLWFFIATAVVYLLQRFPVPGVLLMVVGAAFWSVILVNLGFVGVGLEAVMGRVSRLWLVLPVLYFGGYYLARSMEQTALAQAVSALSRENVGTSLRFDPSERDLFLEKGTGDFHPAASELVRYFGLPRVFDKERMHLIGTPDACALVRNDKVFRSAGARAIGFSNPRGSANRKNGDHFCSIAASGRADRPVVRIISDERKEQRGYLPIRINQFRVRDEASGREIKVHAGSASPLRAFPMPVMGCALNSGAPSWDCFAGFMRRRPTPINADSEYSGGIPRVLATALGLTRSNDLALVASDVGFVEALARAADAELIGKEMAVLERMLADPSQHQPDGWFRHLPNRPEVIAPVAGRIFAALLALQTSDLSASENGRNLWRLAAALPPDALASHRADMIEMLQPGQAREWTQQTGGIYERLNGTVPVEAEILLDRLETRQGDLEAALLSSFCRMGAATPEDAKRRLLRLWDKRAPSEGKPGHGRSREDVPLYFTIARLGLKQQAGQVEQRYYGSTFAAIWAEVTPEFSDELCSGSVDDISNYFRKRSG